MCRRPPPVWDGAGIEQEAIETRGSVVRNILFVCGTLSLACLTNPALAQKGNYGPGVTDTEIKIGQTMPYSGPVSSVGAFGVVEAAYFQKVNAEGGVNGRKINLISLDDAYSPPKTVEQTRRLVESDEVLAIVGSVGTPTNLAVQKYLNSKKVPAIMLLTGADRISDAQSYPWSMAFLPTNTAKGIVFGNFIAREKPNAKIAILFQNDDFGRDYVKGFKTGLGEKAGSMIVKEVGYEVTEPTIESQIIALKATGADVFLDVTSPKASAQAIKRIAEIKWDVTHLLTDSSSSIASVLEPAGLENSKGILSVGFQKDTTDPAWRDDPGMTDYLTFMKQYLPDRNANESFYVVGYSIAQAFVHVLKSCENDLTRENLMKQATSISELQLPLLFPGIKLNTSATQHAPIHQEQMLRFDGSRWVPLGGLVSAEK